MAREDIHDAEIYDRLVENPEDVEGLVAYARYKASECAWMKGYLQRRGHAPSDELLAEYVSAQDDASVERLKTEAQSKLVAFAYEFVENERQQIGEQAVTQAIGNHFQSHETSDVSRHASIMQRLAESGSLRRELAKAVVAAFAVNAITLALIFLVLAPNPIDTFIYLLKHSAVGERVSHESQTPTTKP